MERSIQPPSTQRDLIRGQPGIYTKIKGTFGARAGFTPRRVIGQTYDQRAER